MISLTKSEFCQFNLKSKLKLMKKDGKLLKTKCVTNQIYTVYTLYGFYVELIYDETVQDIVKIAPVPSANWIAFYT